MMTLMCVTTSVRCHTTYVTNYESQQEEECEENFRKNCFINYEKIVDNETVEVCRTEYESECWPKQEEHDVEDDVVECENMQKEKCEDETSGYTTQTKWPSEVYKKYNLVNQCTKEIQNVVAYTEEPVWGFVVDMPVYRTKAGQINIGTTVQKVPELLESGIDEKRCSKLNKCKPEFFNAYHIAPTNCKVGNEVRVARNCAPKVEEVCYTEHEEIEDVGDNIFIAGVCISAAAAPVTASAATCAASDIAAAAVDYFVADYFAADYAVVPTTEAPQPWTILCVYCIIFVLASSTCKNKVQASGISAIDFI